LKLSPGSMEKDPAIVRVIKPGKTKSIAERKRARAGLGNFRLSIKEEHNGKSHILGNVTLPVDTIELEVIPETNYSKKASNLGLVSFLISLMPIGLFALAAVLPIPLLTVVAFFSAIITAPIAVVLSFKAWGFHKKTELAPKDAPIVIVSMFTSLIVLTLVTVLLFLLAVLFALLIAALRSGPF